MEKSLKIIARDLMWFKDLGSGIGTVEEREKRKNKENVRTVFCCTVKSPAT